MRSLHTPQTETNSAYNPGVSYRGGEFMAQGISQASNAITAGLQRYAQNREESAALDTRFESTAKPLMEKLKLYGQLADENSPAAGLLDKSADWHKFGTSQKKVLLADMMLLGDKTEADQRRKEAEQYKLLEIQDRQAQFDETQKQRQLENARHAGRDLWNMGTDLYDRARNAKTDTRLDRNLTLEEDRARRIDADHKATQQRLAQDDARLEDWQRLSAPQPTGPSPMGGEAAHWMSLSQPGSGQPDFSQADPRQTLQPQSLDRITELARSTGAWRHPQYDNYMKDVRDARGKAPYSPAVIPLPGGGSALLTSPSSAMPWQHPDKAAGQPLPQARDGFGAFPDDKGGWTWKPLKAGEGTAGDTETGGRIAQLEHLLQQGGGKDFAFDFDKSQGYSTSRFMHTGESAKAELARLKGQRGGAPSASPAAAGDDKVVVEKDGKKFKLPKGQLEDAKRQGYKLSQ